MRWFVVVCVALLVGAAWFFLRDWFVVDAQPRPSQTVDLQAGDEVRAVMVLNGEVVAESNALTVR